VNGAPSLNQLRDIHLPDAVGWWPPAPGWWLLSGLLLLSAVALFHWRRQIQPRHRSRRLLRQQIDREMSRISQDYQDKKDAAAACSQLSSLMRRVALHCFPHASVAGLQGEAWLRFLDQQAWIGPGFSDTEAGVLLTQGAYQDHAAGDISALITQCSAWIDVVLKQVEQ